jgi:hypothetical protein
MWANRSICSYSDFLVIWLYIIGGTESVCGLPTANKRSIKLETEVTWSKSNLNMMNIYEEAKKGFVASDFHLVQEPRIFNCFH